MKKPNFERFIATAGARYGSVYFGITKNGTIAVHTGFYRKHNISRFKSAQLLYDKGQGLIGVRFSTDEPANGLIKLHHSRSGKNAGIGASSFFKYYGLLPSQHAGRYVPESITGETGEEIHMIDLAEKME